MAITRLVLSVVGPHSGSGKTLFVSHLVRHLRGLGCLKVSPVQSPVESLSDRGDCSGDDFYLERGDQLNKAGKDTAKYLAAGAGQVERLRHRAGGLAPGLEAALWRFPTNMPVIVESSSALAFVDPVAVVLVVRPPIQEMKPATQNALSLVTDLLVNTSVQAPSGEDEAIRLRDQFAKLRPAHTWSADLSRTPPPDEMLLYLRGLLCGDGARNGSL